jgi:hypothetical protein
MHKTVKTHVMPDGKRARRQGEASISKTASPRQACARTADSLSLIESSLCTASAAGPHDSQRQQPISASWRPQPPPPDRRPTGAQLSSGEELVAPLEPPARSVQARLVYKFGGGPASSPFGFAQKQPARAFEEKARLVASSSAVDFLFPSATEAPTSLITALASRSLEHNPFDGLEWDEACPVAPSRESPRANGAPLLAHKAAELLTKPQILATAAPEAGINSAGKAAAAYVVDTAAAALSPTAGWPAWLIDREPSQPTSRAHSAPPPRASPARGGLHDGARSSGSGSQSARPDASQKSRPSPSSAFDRGFGGISSRTRGQILPVAARPDPPAAAARGVASTRAAEVMITGLDDVGDGAPLDELPQPLASTPPRAAEQCAASMLELSNSAARKPAANGAPKAGSARARSGDGTVRRRVKATALKPTPTAPSTLPGCSVADESAPSPPRRVAPAHAPAVAAAASAACTLMYGRPPGARGVRFDKRNCKTPWSARLTIAGKRHYIGPFPTEGGAARGFDQFLLRLGRAPVNFKWRRAKPDERNVRDEKGEPFDWVQVSAGPRSPAGAPAPKAPKKLRAGQAAPALEPHDSAAAATVAPPQRKRQREGAIVGPRFVELHNGEEADRALVSAPPRKRSRSKRPPAAGGGSLALATASAAGDGFAFDPLTFVAGSAPEYAFATATVDTVPAVLEGGQPATPRATAPAGGRKGGDPAASTSGARACMPAASPHAAVSSASLEPAPRTCAEPLPPPPADARDEPPS